MILKRNFLIIFTLAALAGCLADQARAERLFQRTANVNNLGLGMVAEWGGTLRSGGTPFSTRPARVISLPTMSGSGA